MLLGLLCLNLLAGAARADYADSVWLDYQEGLRETGDVIMTDLQVEATALYTYYAGLVWNNGYMGLQRGGGNYFKHVHFSVWDPSGGGMADLVSAGSGVVTERFGGEGTGWKAMWPFTWQENTPYRLCVTLTHTNAMTDYTAYFFNPTAGTWKRLATFRRKDALHTYSYVASFVEDFGGTLNSRRACLLGNAWLRTLAGRWVELKSAKYASGGSKTNKDADAVGRDFRLETGGATTNDTAGYTLLIRGAALLRPTDHEPRIAVTDSGKSVTLQWQTLPWPLYYLDSTPNLPEWPSDQRYTTTSNKWVEALGTNGLRIFRTISSE